MKRIFAALAAVLGFMGIATLVLFFSMAPSLSFPIPLFRGFALPGAGNLTADIAANIGGAAAGPAFPNGQQAIVAVGFPAAPPAAPASTAVASSSASGTASAVSPKTNTEISAAPISASDATPAATASPKPSSSAATSSSETTPVPKLPIASATITVAPIATAPPSLSAPSSQSSEVPPSSASSTLPLPFSESDFAADTRWQVAWGTISAAGGTLELSAGAHSFGGTAYLNVPGAMAWTNYAMNAALTLDGGTFFSLMADYADASDYVDCEYTANIASGTIAMQLAQYAKGYRTPLSSPVTVPWSGKGAALAASIAVNGMYGTCGLNGATATNEGVGVGRAPIAPHAGGTIGFGVNDALPAASAITVRAVTVTAQ